MRIAKWVGLLWTRMRNSWLGLLWARMWVEGKAVDGVHGVFLVFTLFLTSLLRSSPSGCVAYGMGCVGVSLAPPPQPGPMAMAAPSSRPLFLSSLLLSSSSGCVAYGMGCVVLIGLMGFIGSSWHSWGEGGRGEGMGCMGSSWLVGGGRGERRHADMCSPRRFLLPCTIL